jgi:precorrin-2/cobalt-factor-2 C20-methyltransferase
MTGKLIGVGVGPGDPELLTFKAARLIREASVLAYTVDDAGRSHARNTAAQFIWEGQTELPLFFSMSPRREERLKARRNAAEKVLRTLRNGLDVTFITEGDPLLYSTFQHLLSKMPPDVTVDVCPGISAMFAAAAAGCFPLAIEGQAVIVAPAEAAVRKIRGWLEEGLSIVLFKAGQWTGAIREEIAASDLPCEAVLVERASTENEIVARISEEWQERPSHYFSIILIRPCEESENGK